MPNKGASHYDVIVVGCGVAGSTVGAILSALAHKRVIVLERAERIGGRAISFRGEAIREPRDYQNPLGLAANSWVHPATEPELAQLIQKGLLNGYVLEAGGRAAWYTNRGRVSYLLQAFNKPSIFYPNVGFVWFDHEWKAHNVVRGVPYGWMSAKDYVEAHKVSKRLMETVATQEAEKYDRVSLKDWLAQITGSAPALEFHYNLGTFHTILNDPALISAGENMKVVLMSKAAGVHITNGAWGFAGSPGHRFIVEGLAEVIRDHGGEIVTSANVKEIALQNSRVTGVVAEIGGEVRDIKAPVVVSTAPPRAALQLLPPKALSESFKAMLGKTIQAGVVSAHLGLRKPLSDFCKTPIDPRSFFAAPVLVSQDEGFRGHVPIVGCTLSAIAPTQAPEGKHLGMLISNVLDYEARDKKKADRVVEKMLAFMDTAFPGYRQALDWIIFVVTETALCWKHPEDPKPDVKCPSVEGLYFAGDAFGEHANSGGIDAAAHSGVYCAGAITANSYLEVLPPVLR